MKISYSSNNRNNTSGVLTFISRSPIYADAREPFAARASSRTVARCKPLTVPDSSVLRSQRDNRSRQRIFIGPMVAYRCVPRGWSTIRQAWRPERLYFSRMPWTAWRRRAYVAQCLAETLTNGSLAPKRTYMSYIGDVP